MLCLFFHAFVSFTVSRHTKQFFFFLQVRVMIMSLKAGNLGLNMVSACHVILLDLWWNPYAEDQAVDRAHRIGQTRPVTVSRLIVKDTVEERILALQVIILIKVLLLIHFFPCL
jgi:SNF2 family DNA or RNA helicase